MLGWDILAKGMTQQGQVITIASWNAGLGGCQWLDDLVKQGIGNASKWPCPSRDWRGLCERWQYFKL